MNSNNPNQASNRGQRSNIHLPFSVSLPPRARAHTHIHTASPPLPHWLPPVGQSGHAAAIEHTLTTQKHIDTHKTPHTPFVPIHSRTLSLCVSFYSGVEKVSVSRLKEPPTSSSFFSSNCSCGTIELIAMIDRPSSIPTISPTSALAELVYRCELTKHK